MRHLTIGLVLLAGLSSGGISFAQSKPGGATPPPAPPPRMGSLPGYAAPGALRFRNDVVTEAWDHSLTRATAYRITPEADRANRVAALIDSGRCHEAESLASSEHDVIMAEKVPAVCRARAEGKL